MSLRLIPALLAWLFKRKYHIKLKIGRIVLPKLIFRDVILSKDGFTIVSIILIFVVHISECICILIRLSTVMR